MLRCVQTDKAPGAVGPYSQAVAVGSLLFISGQIPINLCQNGDIERGDIKKQTKIVLDNLKGILESEELSLNNIVKTTIFLVNMNDFAAVNEVYGSYFTDHKPARACVAVKELPKGVGIEIEAIASLS